ncbi:ribonuclease [Acidipropionibacterium acidipropionici]|jgi:ribonuclease E|uniref:Ribonuclease E n=1 Tax=Acidipropionibacterium acidipropionici TaxID=1748 RepID=A0AAC8YHU1_9ACTN|nr:Rne/Rng family ribonuclease [Acidipropionibacterium acidipropionici]AMS06830.1 ribonuclease [Acidipropionibacterium acidipropionici]AOZ45614.1 ribonuclease [Acidipropionibacterium acidipropionici]AZP38376.1 ribonuclease [Acidipropionibacterium acidipropionici]QCV95323.1 Rne/Rng family ribonuclease [Acidipropionibacterium acidipropionici]
MVQDTSENSISGDEVTQLQEPTRRRHRAASRPAGAPAATATTTPTTGVVTAAAGSGGSVITADTDTSDLPRPPVGRRRSTRTAASPAAAKKTAAAKQPAAPKTEEPSTPKAEKADRTEKTAPETEEAPRTSRRRTARGSSTTSARRTGGRGRAKPEEAADGGSPTFSDAEAIDAALERAAREAAEKGRGVEGTLANPFGDAGARSTGDILDSLAAEIGGEEAPVKRRRRRTSASAEREVPASAAAQEQDDSGHGAAREDQDEEPEETLDRAAEDEADDSADSDEDSHGARRRRRRGGRRRRRSDSEEGGQEAEGSEEPAGAEKDSGTRGSGQKGSQDKGSQDANADDKGSAGQNGDGEAQEESGVTRRRRRRRRRRGEDTSGAEDDPSDVVVKVREPRPRHSVTDEVTGIEGSTRMEAKKQRRREGRAAGRRRSAVLTEAEFLARRESVERRMVVRQAEEYSQLAVLEDGVLVEHYVDRSSAASSIGNVYLGKVQNVLPSMEAAFIDIGRGRNAVLYAGEVDWNHFGKEGEHKRIEQVLKSGDQVLVQVSKDPVGAKGARLTSHISIPGRYIVYSPGGHLSGISRKLADTERKRLKKIIDENIPSDASVIVRTAAEGASEEDLVRDIERLKSQWQVIERKAASAHAPVLLYSEPDLTVRIIRDLFTADFTELVVAGNGGPDDAYDTIKDYIDHVAPDLGDRLTRWDTETQGDPFAKYRVDEAIAKALERKVFLPSGGSLVIDRTEAMTVIDVNTGKFTGTAGNLEATVAANNLEAAEEIVRQLRLRDIGGIIVVDFIDMVLPANRELLVRRLVECLGRDRTRHQVSEVTSLGLVQMTRKKIGTGLAEAFTEECQECGGRGYHRHTEPVDSQAPADGGERSHKGRANRSHSGKHSNHNSKKN